MKDAQKDGENARYLAVMGVVGAGLGAVLSSAVGSKHTGRNAAIGAGAAVGIALLGQIVSSAETKA